MFRRIVLSMAATAVVMVGAATYAAEARDFNIPPGELAPALELLAKQSGLELIFRSAELKGIRTQGVSGNLTPQEGLHKLIEGTRLTIRTDSAGAILISASTAPVRASADLRLAQAVTPDTATDRSENNSSATSDGQSTGLEEVVVSAQRREQLLSDVPASITAFSSQDIERANIKDLTDYVSSTPNVSSTQSGIRSERDISIRGVSNIGGRVSAFAFYVDDFNVVNGPRGRQTDTINSSINPQLQDVERIEVLRGPQGTFFGRNATAGAVNIVMKKPTPDFHGEVSAEYGRFDTGAVGGVLNLPLTDNTLFLRVSAFREETDGAVRNVNPVGKGSGNDYTNARIALRALPSERLTVDLSANYAKENTGTVEQVATGVLSATSLSLVRLAGLTGAISDGLGFYPDNVDRYNHDVRERQSNRFVTLVGKVEYERDAVTLTSITGYLESELVSLTDLDFTSRGIIQQLNPPRSESFSQEIRLSATSPGRLDWLIGTLYAKDTVDQPQAISVGPAGLGPLPPGFLLDGAETHTGTKSYALFGEAVWHATEKLDLTLGGRYTRDELEQRAARVLNQVPLPPRAGEISFDDFSPRFALTYRATDDLTAYATVSKGYKAGALNLNETRPQFSIVDYQAEKIWNYEGGLRLEAFGDRLRVNTSAFYMRWTDMQVLTVTNALDPATGQPLLVFVQLTGNAADATTKGIELELQARPTTALRLGGAVGYLDATFERFPNAVVQGATADLSGKPIPRAPKWTGGAHAEYGFTVRNDWPSFVRAEWNYRDQTFPNVNSLVLVGFPYRTPSFGVWNFRAGVDTGKLSVSAYVENAFDEQYFTKLEEVSLAGTRVNPSYRTYGVKFNLRFD